MSEQEKKASENDAEFKPDTGETSTEDESLTREDLGEFVEPLHDEKLPDEVKEPDGAAKDDPEEDPATPAGEETVAKDDSAKTPKGVQKRIDAVVRKQREAERKLQDAEADRDAWRKMVVEKDEKAKEDDAEKGAATTKEGGGKPLEADFDDYATFVEKLSAWSAEQKFQKLQAEERTAQEAKAQKEQSEAYDKKFDKGREKFSDFDEVALSKDIPYSDTMTAAVLESKHMEEIAYHLGQHPDEAKRIFGLSPTAAVREIIKLEEQFSPSTTPTKKKTTEAPDPVSIVGSSEVVGKDPNKMTNKQYRAFRESQQKQRKEF